MKPCPCCSCREARGEDGVPWHKPNRPIRPRCLLKLDPPALLCDLPDCACDGYLPGRDAGNGI